MRMDLEEIVTCLLVVAVSYLLLTLWKQRSWPPGPWGLPVLGYLPFLDPDHPYLTMTALAERYGPIYSMQMGKVLAVVVSDPKVIRRAFNKHQLSGRADLYLAHGIMDGHGIIGTTGAVWKEQRKFAVSCLKSLGVTKSGSKRDKIERLILSGVDSLIERLAASDSDGQPIDTEHAFNHHIGNVINRLLFGRTFGEDDDVWKLLQHLSDDGLRKMGEGGIVNFLPLFRFLPKYRRVLDFVLSGLTKTHSIYQAIVDEHCGEEDDVIACYLKEMKSRGDGNRGSFTDRQLMYFLGDLFGAGLDTSATSLRWFLLCVACHPTVQNRLYDEIVSVCGDSSPRLNDAPRLPYLEAVIAETLRFRPVVPMGVPHGATESCTLENYLIPEGAMVIPLQWAVHMSGHYWHEPHLFKPERFLDSEGNVCKPEAFMPFQVGKRICLGEELGKMMLYLFASNIVTNFNVMVSPDAVSKCSDPLEGDFQMLLKPRESHLRFTRRKPSAD